MGRKNRALAVRCYSSMYSQTIMHRLSDNADVNCAAYILQAEEMALWQLLLELRISPNVTHPSRTYYNSTRSSAALLLSSSSNSLSFSSSFGTSINGLLGSALHC